MAVSLSTALQGGSWAVSIGLRACVCARLSCFGMREKETFFANVGTETVAIGSFLLLHTLAPMRREVFMEGNRLSNFRNSFKHHRRGLLLVCYGMLGIFSHAKVAQQQIAWCTQEKQRQQKMVLHVVLCRPTTTTLLKMHGGS